MLSGPGHPDQRAFGSADGSCAHFASARFASRHARSSGLGHSRRSAGLPLGAWLGRSATSSGPRCPPAETRRLPRQHPNRSRYVQSPEAQIMRSGQTGAHVVIGRNRLSGPVGRAWVAFMARWPPQAILWRVGDVNDATGRGFRSSSDFAAARPQPALRLPSRTSVACATGSFENGAFR